MDKQLLAIFPYCPDDCNYIGTMHGFLSNKYSLVNYEYVRDGVIPVEQVGCIYLNWIESILKSEDRAFLEKAREKEVPIIWVFHNRIPHDSNEIESIEKTRWIAEICTRVILHSKNSLDILIEIVPSINKEKAVYIPHPDFVGDYYGTGDIRSKMGANDNDIVFGFLGRIRRYKNIEILIDCYKTVSSLYQAGTKLLIAGECGDEEYREEIRQMTGRNAGVVIEDRYISSCEMKSYLEAVDVLVLPYDKASSMNSGSMIMAFSYGRTVIVPDIAMANDFKMGMLFRYEYETETEHKEALVEQMRMAIEDGKELLHKKGAELRKYICQYHSKELVRSLLLKYV